MSNNDQTKNRDAVKQTIEEAEKSASEIEQLGHEMVRAGRFTRDVAKTVRELVDKVPNDDMLPEEETQRTKEAWDAVRATAQPILRTKSYLVDYTAVVSASTTSTLPFIYDIGPLTTPVKSAIQTAQRQLGEILEGVPLVEEVRASLVRLRLNDVTNRRSPMQLLDDAKLALDRPQTQAADAAGAVLLPLRECVESCVAELLRRRPQQEETRKAPDKMKSIVRQCGRQNLGEDHFNRLGLSCSDLLNRLSGTKQATMPRNEIIRLFNEGLLFLKAFTESIDETKLRD